MEHASVVVRSKRMSERCEQTSERANGQASGLVLSRPIVGRMTRILTLVGGNIVRRLGKRCNRGGRGVGAVWGPVGPKNPQKRQKMPKMQ